MAPLSMAMQGAKLELPHFEAPSVFAPVGTHWARPIVIALHGEEESAEAACATWSAVTNRDYFVLCPQISSKAQGAAAFSCASGECLANEIREGIIALRQRFGRYVAPKEVMLVGRGAGAAWAVPIALQNPAVFSAVWLVNGGLREWSSAVSVSYAKRGGKFLGVACDSPICASETPRVQTSAKMAGLITAVVKSGDAGPPGAQVTVDTIRKSWQSTKPTSFPWAARR